MSQAYNGRAIYFINNQAIGLLVGTQHGLHLRGSFNTGFEDIRAAVITETQRGSEWPTAQASGARVWVPTLGTEPNTHLAFISTTL